MGAWLGSVRVWLGAWGRGSTAVPGVGLVRVGLPRYGRAEGVARELGGVSTGHGAWLYS